MSNPAWYQIQIRGHLDPRWSAWFNGWAILHAFASFIYMGFTPGNPYLGAPVGALSLLPFVALDLWLVLSGRLNLTTNE